VELSGLGEKKISSDPTVQQMYFEVKRYGDNINNRLMKEIHDIEKQRNDLVNTRDTEAERRQKSNEFTQQINDRHHLVAQRIAELNKRLSQLAGKPIDVGSREIDWSKNSTQFRD
jgi:septal ring factor EnvC (AmiA/AmiB activator)